MRNALTAGAIGFTTSRSPSHETPDSRPVASRMASWDEVRRLVGVMGELNAGIFELAGEGVDRKVDHPDLPDYHKRLKALAVATGRPITFGLFTRKDAPDMWRHYVKLIEETNAAGGRMFAQVHSRALCSCLVQDPEPFDRLPVWKELRALPLPGSRRAGATPRCGRKWSASRCGTAARPSARGPAGRHGLDLVLDSWTHAPLGGRIARERNCDPGRPCYRLAVERDMDRFFFTRSTTRTRSSRSN